jgi:BarA-like signal transduction histidine kinase
VQVVETPTLAARPAEKLTLRVVFSAMLVERPMTIQEDRSRALALAGGAIVSALLDVLVEKNILTTREVRAALLKAINGIAPFAQTTVGYEASGMIAAMMHDRFDRDRG